MSFLAHCIATARYNLILFCFSVITIIKPEQAFIIPDPVRDIKNIRYLLAFPLIITPII